MVKIGVIAVNIELSFIIQSKMGCVFKFQYTKKKSSKIKYVLCVYDGDMGYDFTLVPVDAPFNIYYTRADFLDRLMNNNLVEI